MLTPAQIQNALDSIQRDGYCIVPGAIEPDFVDALLADLTRLERELNVQPAENDFEGSRTLRIYNLLVYGKLWERIPVYETVLPIVEGVLDHGCLVSSLSSINIGPEETAQPIHADDQLIPAAEARAMADAIPGAQFSLIPAAGHLAPIEQAVNTGRVIREFLEALL